MKNKVFYYKLKTTLKNMLCDISIAFQYNKVKVYDKKIITNVH